MRIAIAALLLCCTVARAPAFAGAPAGRQDGADEKVLEDFEKEWKKHRHSPEGRKSAVASLTIHRTEKVLAVLIEKLEHESDKDVRQELVAAIGQYQDSEKAVAALVEQLGGNTKMPNVVQAALAGLAEAQPKLTRPHVEKVNALVKHKELGIAVAAIKALGYSPEKGIRHKSSLVPLVERLRRAQLDIKDYIRGTIPKNCDGG